MDSLFISNVNRGVESYTPNVYTLKLRGRILPSTSTVHSRAHGDRTSVQLQQHEAHVASPAPQQG